MNITILGAGKVGRGLSRALAGTGHRVRLLPSRRGPSEPIRDALLVLAVRDGAITDTASALADGGWVSRRTAVVHVAGALGADALSPLKGKCAGIGQAHPMLSFASARRVPELSGALLLVGGDAKAVSRASRMGKALGMVPRAWRVDRALYHAAGGLVANGAVALAASGAELLRRAGAPPTETAQLLAALLRSVADNVAELGLPEALSGPVRRGDAKTVAGHLAALRRAAPELLPVYRECAKLQLKLAEALGDAEPAALAAVARTLGGASRRR
jgi:predicted short-subunit dehydrogenase-like oxidoreductase (DUF2520 family)